VPPQAPRPPRHGEGASDTVEKDEATTENYLAGLAHSWRELASLPPAVVAIAASDQTDEQRTFFVAQSVGEMIIERDRFLGADGAARLGEILAVRPLMKPSDFVTSLHLATEIQEHRLEEFGGPPESESSPLALIASWCKSALAQPAKWTGRVSSLEQVALRINNGEATCTFSRVVSAILHAMPSKVEAGLNQDHAETPAENGTTRIVVVPRGTAEQYHCLTRWLCKAVRAVDVAVTRAAEQGHGSASTTADEVQLRMAALHQAACLSKALCEAIQEEHPLSATAY